MSSSDYETRLWNAGIRSRCYSYYYLSAKGWSARTVPSYEASLKLGMKILLDSGAHTFHQLFAKGKFGSVQDTIKKFTDEYIQFCHKEKKRLAAFVTFDYRRDANLCWEIRKYFEKSGLTPMPVFHGDVNPEFMKKYLDLGYEEIGISPVLLKGSHMEHGFYLDQCFRVLCDSQGRPRLRIHGFGAGRVEQMANYPFYSVDSATWCRAAAYGKILIFDLRRRKTVLPKVTKQKSKDSYSYWNFSRPERREFDKVIESHGFTVEQLSEEGTPGTENRALFNAKIFTETAQKVATDKFQPQWGRLF